VRVDADVAVLGSSNRTVFCGKFAVVGCARVNPVAVVAAAGFPNEMLPKPAGFAPSPPALGVAAVFALYLKNKQLK